MFAHYNHANPADFGIPVAKSKTFTYVNKTTGATETPAADDALVGTITYKNEDGVTLGVLTFTYILTTNNVSTITRTS